MKTENNTFIVTGGASGLGAATVRALHGAGANVVIADLNAEQGDALVAELGSRAAFARTNVADEADAQAAVALAVSRFGGLQGLVSCAGIGNAARVLGKEGPMPLEAFSRSIQVNLVGTFNMIRIAADTMAKGEPGPDGERGRHDARAYGLAPRGASRTGRDVGAHLYIEAIASTGRAYPCAVSRVFPAVGVHGPRGVHPPGLASDPGSCAKRVGRRAVGPEVSASRNPETDPIPGVARVQGAGSAQAMRRPACSPATSGAEGAWGSRWSSWSRPPRRGRSTNTSGVTSS